MKSYIVLGLGRFGRSIAKALFDMGHEVLGVDADERNVADFSRYITHTFEADITSEDFLKSMDVRKFDAVIVSVGANMQVSIMVTVIVKELGAQYILCKAQDDFQEKILYKVGADKVIQPEKDMGLKAARNISSDNLYDMIELSKDHSIVSMRPPKGWQGKSLGELAVRTKHGVNIIAVKGTNGEVAVPHADTVLTCDCPITVMGRNDDLRRLASIR